MAQPEGQNSTKAGDPDPPLDPENQDLTILVILFTGKILAVSTKFQLPDRSTSIASSPGSFAMKSTMMNVLRPSLRMVIMINFMAQFHPHLQEFLTQLSVLMSALRITLHISLQATVPVIAPVVALAVPLVKFPSNLLVELPV